MIEYAVGAAFGAVVATVAGFLRGRRRWRIQITTEEEGMLVQVRRGRQTAIAHAVGFDRLSSENPDVPFDEQFARAVSQARTALTTINAGERMLRGAD